MNRKGVALPTCSEATKKAKRESLAQKQILVPELCQIHTYPASLWRKAVALPCIMYRLNCLLLAEEIRNQVSHEIDLGLNTVPEGDYFIILRLLRISKKGRDSHVDFGNQKWSCSRKKWAFSIFSLDFSVKYIVGIGIEIPKIRRTCSFFHS